jgi:hypothetical protein
MSLSSQLRKLADEILDKALADATPLEQKLEAFKIISGYHVALKRVEKGRDDDAAEGQSFDKLRTGLRAVGGKDA